MFYYRFLEVSIAYNTTLVHFKAKHTFLKRIKQFGLLQNTRDVRKLKLGINTSTVKLILLLQLQKCWIVLGMFYFNIYIKIFIHGVNDFTNLK